MEDLRLERRGGLALAAFAGELVSEKVPGLRREMDRLLADPGCRTLVLDLADVSFLDSSGIGFLVSLAARAKAEDKHLRLLDLSPQARKTLELVQLIAYFEVLQGREALAGLQD
ncbi:MAG: STAS domain-containing protein [Thermodesulfobacteriota bacterium]